MAWHHTGVKLGVVVGDVAKHERVCRIAEFVADSGAGQRRDTRRNSEAERGGDLNFLYEEGGVLSVLGLMHEVITSLTHKARLEARVPALKPVHCALLYVLTDKCNSLSSYQMFPLPRTKRVFCSLDLWGKFRVKNEFPQKFVNRGVFALPLSSAWAF